MYARYALLTLVQLIFTGVAFVFAPVLALFCNAAGWLPGWLTWFQTFDASCDAGWQDGYAGFNPDDSRWWNRTKWLWRNPAYGFCYWPLGVAYDPSQWVIGTLEHDGVTLTRFSARTTDGRHFAYTDSTGAKYGIKLWWALDATFALAPAPLPASRGPSNRLPLAFTPSLAYIKSLFA